MSYVLKASNLPLGRRGTGSVTPVMKGIELISVRDCLPYLLVGRLIPWLWMPILRCWPS